jgi:hypothetical protein
MDLGAVLEDDVGVAGVGERVGDGQVVAPHHADVELPDHLLLGRRRHCAGVGFGGSERAVDWWGQAEADAEAPTDTREGRSGLRCSPVDAANGWRPARPASWIILQPIIVRFLLMTDKAGLNIYISSVK